MTKAVVCLPLHSKKVVSEILSIIRQAKVKVFNSVDEGFEYLWNEGIDIGLFILDVDDAHVDELWKSALDWPNLQFIAVHDDAGCLPVPLSNMLLIHQRDFNLENNEDVSRLISTRASLVV